MELFVILGQVMTVEDDKQRTWMIQLAGTCHGVRAYFRTQMWDFARSSVWKREYVVYTPDFIYFDSKGKIKKQIRWRIDRMRSDEVRLNGVERAEGPVNAKPNYRPRSGFTGRFTAQWNDLEVAEQSEHCMGWSQSGATDADTIIQLCEGVGESASDRLHYFRRAFGPEWEDDVEHGCNQVSLAP